MNLYFKHFFISILFNIIIKIACSSIKIYKILLDFSLYLFFLYFYRHVFILKMSNIKILFSPFQCGKLYFNFNFYALNYFSHFEDTCSICIPVSSKYDDAYTTCSGCISLHACSSKTTLWSTGNAACTSCSWCQVTKRTSNYIYFFKVVSIWIILHLLLMTFLKILDP